MTQILATAKGFTIDSATLISDVNHTHSLNNRDCGVLEVGITDHCATSVKLTFSFKNFDETDTTYIFSLPVSIKMQKKLNRKNFKSTENTPNLYDDLDEQFELF